MATPYDIEIIAEQIHSYWAQRKMALLKYWDFYTGDRQRWYLDRYEGETVEEYENRVAGATVENHCAKTCDVLVAYLYGQPDSKKRVAVRIVDNDGKIIEELQRLFADNFWVHNDIDSFRLDVALMASVTGVGIVHKEFVDSRTMLPFDRLATKDEKRKYGTVRYDLFDSVDTMPLPFVSTRDIIYPRRLGAIVRYYTADNFSGIGILDKMLATRYAKEDILEVYDNNRVVIARVPSGKPLDKKVYSHPYANVEVLFTIFRNYGDPMYIEGESDLVNMVELQNTLNTLVNADKLTIDYHSAPILKMLNGARLPQNFIRKVNSALEFDGEQNAEYLTWDNTLEASANMQESMRRQMTVVSGVSQLSRGNATDIGQVRSGAGLKTLFQADINAIGLKIPHFVKAEKELIRSTLKMWSIETGASIPDYQIVVEFPDDFVGLDELVKAESEQIELEAGIRTLREFILQKHPEIKSEAELEALIKEFEEKQEKQAELERPPMAQSPGKQATAQSKTKSQ